MAFHILPPGYHQRSSGNILGQGLGQGLANLAQNKVNEIEFNKKAQAWQNMGLAPEVAHFIVRQPESIQKDFVSRLEGLGSSQEYAPSTGTQNESMISNSKSANAPVITFGKSKEQKQEDAKRFKETKDIRSKLVQEKKSSRQEIQDLNRLAELSESGKLDTPGYLNFLENAGLDIPSLMSPESQEFKKIQQGFLKNAKDIFGGRVTNQELESFLQTVPSLSQSPEGRQRVISNMKRFAQAKQEYYKAYEEVLKENKGIPPYDLEEQVERKAEKKIEKLSEHFKKELQKPIPKGQNKLITALQSGAGTLLGKVPKALAGAGAGAVGGAALGTIAGLPGAATGAALGGLAGLAGISPKF